MGWVPCVGLIYGVYTQVRRIDLFLLATAIIVTIYLIGLMDNYRLSLITVDKSILIDTLFNEYEFEFEEIDRVKVIRNKSTYCKVRIFFSSGHKFDFLGKPNKNYLSFFEDLKNTHAGSSL